MGGMEGKTVVITGASSGIGLETARALAKMGARIIAVVRNRDKAQHALVGTAAELVIADLYSLAAVRAAAAEIRAKVERLDVLVNNAGMIHDTHELTVDGFERTFALNHLAAFLLSYELRTLLGEGSRLVTVASEGHRFARFEWDDLATSSQSWGSIRAYANSKLCNIWFARESARRLAARHVTSNALHPGTVASNFGASGGAVFRTMAKLSRPFLLSSKGGARTSVYASSAPELDGVTGEYLKKSRIAKASRQARDDAGARQLWKLSEKLCGVSWA